MKDQRYVWNPFRMISPLLDSEAGRQDKLYEMPVSASLAPEEGLIVMISKVIEITRVLSSCFLGDDSERLKKCTRLAAEVHEHEKLATTGLLDASSVIGQNLFRLVVRFPSRIERIGIMFENILACARIKTEEGVLFSDIAQKELSEIFRFVVDLLINLRDALMLRNNVLLEHLKTQSVELGKLVEDARFAHWDRVEAGFCAPAASSLYLEILDCLKQINEYVARMHESLTAISEEDEQADS